MSEIALKTVEEGIAPFAPDRKIAFSSANREGHRAWLEISGKTDFHYEIDYASYWGVMLELDIKRNPTSEPLDVILLSANNRSHQADILYGHDLHVQALAFLVRWWIYGEELYTWAKRSHVLSQPELRAQIDEVLKEIEDRLHKRSERADEVALLHRRG